MSKYPQHKTQLLLSGFTGSYFLLQNRIHKDCAWGYRTFSKLANGRSTVTMKVGEKADIHFAELHSSAAQCIWLPAPSAGLIAAPAVTSMRLSLRNYIWTSHFLQPK